MKKKLTAVLCCAATAFACSFGLAACNEKPEETPPPPMADYNNVAFDGLDDIIIDRTTESFDVMDGVTAVYSFDDDTQENLTEKVRYVLPAAAHVDDGAVTFDECGDYEITYYVNDDKGNHTAAKRTVKVRNMYNCYWVNATLPVLYCALDMVSNDYKSMLVFTRSDTLNIDELDDDRFIYKVNGSDDDDFLEAKRRMARIASDDENSYFRLFIGDTLAHLELFSFMQYRVPTSRYEVKLVSDGSLTYCNAFPYRSDGSIEKWNENKNIYNQAVDAAMMGNFVSAGNGQFSITVGDRTIKSSYTKAADMSEMAIIAAQRDNVEMWCGYPETLKSADPKVQAEIDKANMPKMSPDAMYAALTDAQKEKFLKICNLDKATFDKEYFDKDGEYLIITGANPFTSRYFTDAEFAELLERIIADYDGYNILYKPHPLAVEPGDDLPLTKKVLTDNAVKILPGRLPMEVITWVYGDVKLGGFDSSLFMAVPQGNTEFFIAQNADALSVLSKQLYNDGAFGSPKFYWKAA